MTGIQVSWKRMSTVDKMNVKLILLYVLFDFLEGAIKVNIGEKITNNGVNAGDQFGFAVAINSKYIIIASERDIVGGKVDMGSVSVHVNKAGYPLLKKLYPADGAANDQFGSSVALNNKYIVIGSRYHKATHDSQGSVYVYNTNGETWSYEKIVVHRAGSSVDINEDNEIIIGAPTAASKGVHSGVAYVYSCNGGSWTLKQQLVPSTVKEFDLLGFTVAITTHYIALTARQDSSNPNFYGEGSVYIYRKNSKGLWVEDTRITSPSPGKYGTFGHSISIDDKYLVIGATLEDSSRGNAYVYVAEGNTWKHQATLITEDHQYSYYYGLSVAIHKTTIVVATLDAETKKIGAAHVFELSNGKWVEVGKLIDADIRHRFGVHSLAIFDGTVVAGCGLADDNNKINSGAAYMYLV